MKEKDRLTARVPNGEILVKVEQSTVRDEKTGKLMLKPVKNPYELLARYEDTGLSPGEIMEIVKAPEPTVTEWEKEKIRHSAALWKASGVMNETLVGMSGVLSEIEAMRGLMRRMLDGNLFRIGMTLNDAPYHTDLETVKRNKRFCRIAEHEAIRFYTLLTVILGEDV